MTIDRMDERREYRDGTSLQSSRSLPADSPEPCGLAETAAPKTSASESASRLQQSSADRTDELESMMSRFSIYFDGRRYRYRGYRYERVADALAYARLMQARHSEEDLDVTASHDSVVQSPSDSDRRLMQQLSISFEAGVYRFAAFRYDDLADAVNYARTCQRRAAASHSDASKAPSNVHRETTADATAGDAT